MKLAADLIEFASMFRHLRSRVLLLVLLFVVRGVVAAESRLSSLDLFGPPAHHHPAGERHHHGDKDDRHDFPGSPCHHHDDHCDCGTPDDPTMNLPATGAGPARGIELRAHLAPEHGELPPLACEVFHPPLA